MDRIATSTSYQSSLLNILSAQSAQNTAQAQYTTGKLATDLDGYSAQADVLTATNTLQARTTTYIANGAALSDRLTVQDQALSQVATNTESARSAVAEALATGDSTALITNLQSQLSQTVSTLNTQYEGRYLFAGGVTNTAPATAQNLTDLTAAGGVAATFKNDNNATVSRLDDNTKVTTGFTASSVATPLFNALAQIQTYNAGPNGPLTGTLTTAQTTFLTGVLSTFDSAYASVNNQVAQNGLVQTQVATSQSALKNTQTALTSTANDLTEVDQAKAATTLTLAQTALQASAQVFSSLKSVSLLNYLTST